MMSSMRRFFCAIVLATGLSALAATPASARLAPDSFADQVERLNPAVVNISTTQKINPQAGIPAPLMDEQFRQFFEKMLPPGSELTPGMPLEQEAQSLGSGFIIDPKGYIVTNNHVIEGATEIQVILSDKTTLAAKVVGKDTKTDLALLKVETDKTLPSVTFGDSDKARVGDWVIAIGNPFGLGGTVTAGIISARARNINAGPFDDFIQTDASINRGNSGGPLFNLLGEVVGINTAIFSPSGGSVGIGFAVPANLAKPVIDQLKEHGRTFRGWLGVKIQTVTDEIAESLNMKKAKGALVADVTADGPAAKAGLKTGDVILTFDGKTVEEMRYLPRMVAETAIGKAVKITFLRDGKERSSSVTLGELQEEEPAAERVEETQKLEETHYTTFDILGMKIATIDDSLRKKFAMDSAQKGVVVVEISRSSEAAKQGLRFGDVITKVNDNAVTELKHFKDGLEQAKKAGRKNALLQVIREGQVVFVTIPTEAKKK